MVCSQTWLYDKGFGELPSRSAMYEFEGIAALLQFSSLFFILHPVGYAFLHRYSI